MKRIGGSSIYEKCIYKYRQKTVKVIHNKVKYASKSEKTFLVDDSDDIRYNNKIHSIPLVSIL